MWFLLLFILFTSPINAQEATVSAQTPTPTPPLFLQYQKDYLYQYDLYQQAYLKYVEKKEVFTKYGTITTQNEKFTAAIDTINARNKTFKAYLTALRIMLDEYQSANSTNTEKVKIDITKWEAWFEEQMAVVPAINNEEDLIKWVKEFKINYITVQQVMYTALIQHEVNLRVQTLNLLKDTADYIKNSPNVQPESQSWLNSLTIKSDLVNTSLTGALDMAKRKQIQNKFSDFYPNARIEMNKANNYLREISADLKLTIIKFLK
jgi:hypothetical protein